MTVSTTTAAEPRPNPSHLSARIPKLIPRSRPPARREAPSAPPPPTPPLPPPSSDLQGHRYARPVRRILSPHDHERFLQSSACALVTSFVFGVADSARDRAVSSVGQYERLPIIDSILDILKEAEDILDANPPEDTGSRFGNPMFRTFLDGVAAALPKWHTSHLALSSEAQIDEISTYLVHSFGNKRRIDYGSGHELNFFVWLLCLNRVSLLPAHAFPAVALVLLPAYMGLMRRVQTAYYLEPAGSHGVWGLDDYQFLPFLVGASQLLHHAYITPKAVHNALVLEDEGPEYLYLDQVAFVNSVKKVDGLRWHSPMLDDISAARSWAKIDAGMRKMFVADILGKLPVMQHFLFGSLVPAAEGMASRSEGDADIDAELDAGPVQVFDDDLGRRHVHQSTGWGDCCGIKVPAAVGAEGEERKRGAAAARLRRVPFD